MNVPANMTREIGVPPEYDQGSLSSISQGPSFPRLVTECSWCATCFVNSYKNLEMFSPIPTPRNYQTRKSQVKREDSAMVYKLASSLHMGPESRKELLGCMIMSGVGEDSRGLL